MLYTHCVVCSTSKWQGWLQELFTIIATALNQLQERALQKIQKVQQDGKNAVRQ